MICRICSVELTETNWPLEKRLGLGHQCVPCRAAYSKQWAARNVDKCNAKAQRYRRKMRLRVLEAYGGKCACCGEATPEFLSIDHIDGNGNAHRRAISKYKNAAVFYFWLVKQGFPPGFRVLCYNCNCARGFYGRCPHEGPIEPVS